MSSGAVERRRGVPFARRLLLFIFSCCCSTTSSVITFLMWQIILPHYEKHAVYHQHIYYHIIFMLCPLLNFCWLAFQILSVWPIQRPWPLALHSGQFVLGFSLKNGNPQAEFEVTKIHLAKCCSKNWYSYHFGDPELSTLYREGRQGGEWRSGR